MESFRADAAKSQNRRQRLHEILIALIQREEDLELIDANSHGHSIHESHSPEVDPARWIDRNRRIIKKYKSLVRSAITLDALLDTE